MPVNKKSIPVPVVSEFDVLAEKLRFVDENIKETVKNQPMLFLDAGRYRVKCMRNRAVAVAAVDSMRARVATAIRNDKNSAGLKMTEGALKEQIELDPEIQDLRDAQSEAYEDEEMGKLLVEAWRQRNSAVKNLVEMMLAEGASGSYQLEREVQTRAMNNKAQDLLQGKTYKRRIGRRDEEETEE